MLLKLSRVLLWSDEAGSALGVWLGQKKKKEETLNDSSARTNGEPFEKRCMLERRDGQWALVTGKGGLHQSERTKRNGENGGTGVTF